MESMYGVLETDETRAHPSGPGKDKIIVLMTADG